MLWGPSYESVLFYFIELILSTKKGLYTEGITTYLTYSPKHKTEHIS